MNIENKTYKGYQSNDNVAPDICECLRIITSALLTVTICLNLQKGGVK